MQPFMTSKCRCLSIYQAKYKNYTSYYPSQIVSFWSAFSGFRKHSLLDKTKVCLYLYIYIYMVRGYCTLPWLYITLLESSTLYHGSTWLYFTLFDSTTLYYASTWLYLILLNSITLYLWLYWSLLHSTMVLYIYTYIIHPAPFVRDAHCMQPLLLKRKD